jgi:hypothetical protein
MAKTKTYAPPKGGVGANNVEINDESSTDLIGQHDTIEDEDIVMTEVSDNEIPGIPLDSTLESPLDSTLSSGVGRTFPLG